MQSSLKSHRCSLRFLFFGAEANFTDSEQLWQFILQRCRTAVLSMSKMCLKYYIFVWNNGVARSGWFLRQDAEIIHLFVLGESADTISSRLRRHHV